MSPSRIGPTSGEVVIVRSGHATDAQWWKSINDALRLGRDVHAIDGAGRSVHYPASGGMIEVEEDW